MSRDRPQRLHKGPTITTAIATFEDVAYNFQIIQSGGLADGRSLEGRQGVYAVKVVPPLAITDNGIVLNMHDLAFGWQLQYVIAALDLDAKAHDLLNGAVHGDTVAHVGALGDLVYFTAGGWDGLAIVAGGVLIEAGGGIPAWLAPGANGQVLTLAVGLPSWQDPAGVEEHNLLDGTVHPDTVAGEVAEGKLIRGNNATPSKWALWEPTAEGDMIYGDAAAGKWAIRPIGNSNDVLTVDTGVPTWKSRADVGIPLPADDVEDVTTGAEAAGSAITYSRGDHVHHFTESTADHLPSASGQSDYKVLQVQTNAWVIDWVRAHGA